MHWLRSFIICAYLQNKCIFSVQMEIIQDAQLDIIHHLIQRDLIFIVEEIFSFLDFSSLTNCELVSKDWNLAIKNGRSWQKIYDKESKKNPLFHKALLGYEEHEESKHQDENNQLFLFKRLFQTRHKIQKNWALGNYSTTILKIGKFFGHFPCNGWKEDFLGSDSWWRWIPYHQSG